MDDRTVFVVWEREEDGLRSVRQIVATSEDATEALRRGPEWKSLEVEEFAVDSYEPWERQEAEDG